MDEAPQSALIYKTLEETSAITIYRNQESICLKEENCS